MDGFSGKRIYKWLSFNCHVWLPEGIERFVMFCQNSVFHVEKNNYRNTGFEHSTEIVILTSCLAVQNWPHLDTIKFRAPNVFELNKVEGSFRGPWSDPSWVCPLTHNSLGGSEKSWRSSTFVDGGWPFRVWNIMDSVGLLFLFPHFFV